MTKKSVAPIRRIFWDIENSPLRVFSWSVGRKITISHDNIIAERAIICISWKWEGEKKVHSLNWDKNQCDKTMIEKFVKVLSRSDEAVAHWGNAHDAPWIRTRALFHGIKVPPFKTVDTCRMAMKKLAFASCKLDYLAKFFGIGQKMETGFGLWREVVLNNSACALKKMERYCKNDVALLEQVWKRLDAISEPSTHVGVLYGGEKFSCPKCGSCDVATSKTNVTAKGVKQYQMQCKKDGTYFSISQSVHDKYLESKK